MFAIAKSLPKTQFFTSTLRNSLRTYVAVGEKLPSINLFESSPGNAVDLSEETKSGKTIVIGAPGAFSPACNSTHVPGYIKHLRAFNDKGYQKFFVVSVNDPFVTKNWGEYLLHHTVAGHQVRFLADPAGEFTKELGLLFDATKVFGNERSKRYTFLLEDGVITKTFIEPDGVSVDVSDANKVLEELFDISYSRSSGPGGQKVNKTSSKATIALGPGQWLIPATCYWIPQPIQHQLKENKIRYETKVGGLLIQSDVFRSRDDNASECFKKLLDEIKSKVYFPGEISEEDKQKWERLEKLSKERRKLQKKQHSEKKKSRSKNFDW
ncbi:Peroxiredoxin-5 mitochondrial [Spathaspora sp. JA1]|nr:Peroxiredoxin-5 mitochondrial [Spathaspora sp. JA1]